MEHYEQTAGATPTPCEADLLVRYQRARSLLSGIWNNRVVRNTAVFPSWIEGHDCCWYERELVDGKEFRLVDPSTQDNKPAFDHIALATALSKAAGQSAVAQDLPISKLSISLTPSYVSFTAFDKSWQYTPQDHSCIETVDLPAGWVLSPDKTKAIFARDHNLWLHDIESGNETLLTEDGEEDFAYGVAGTAWGGPPGAMELQVQWSPNGSSLLSIRRDRRGIKTLPVVNHVPEDGDYRPSVEHIKVAYPGDETIETLQVIVINLDTGKIKTADYRPIPVTRSDWGLITSKLGWWDIDSSKVYFVDLTRDYKTVRLMCMDVLSGNCHLLFEEHSLTQINLMLNSDEVPSIMPLPESSELIWFSERSGWAHLYLYDLETGALKRQLTKGEWLVRDLVSYSIERRELVVQTAGRVAGRDPYYRDLYRINLDTGEQSVVVDEDCEIWAVSQYNHNIQMLRDILGKNGADTACSMSPSGNYAVITSSRANEVPVSSLLDRDGSVVMELERADIDGLPKTWQWPEPVCLKAADEHTDIYGLIFRPSDFSPDRQYPVISHLFSSPEYPLVAKGSFSSASLLGWAYLDAAALAELGFIVVQIDGRGLPFRNKAFQDESYGGVETVSNIEDHVVGLKQLAERYSYMDLDRVGVSTHLGGGPGGLQGLLQFPDFYKVGVSGCLHDSRLLSAAMWGEKFEGLAGSNTPAPETLVHKLKGKLLLAHGLLDWCSPPAATLRVIDALQNANKDFDMLLLPRHGHGSCDYVTRRSWDYFVQHLLGQTPPQEFNLSEIG